MKEERLIGNSGIQEVRQQCLDVLAEIREQAGILNDYFEVTDNPEYIAAWVDGDGKIIFGLKTDGKTFVGDADFLDDLKRIKEFLPLWSKIDWDALSIITLTEDPEGRSEIITDSEDKIVSYRDSKGVLHEEAGIESESVKTNSLQLTPSGMNEFQQALIESGFKPVGTGDWSDYLSNDGDYPLCIPEPRCAMFNINTDVNLVNLTKEGRGGTAGVNYDVPCEVEFWDMSGNYFKKWALISGQGNSTLNWLKKSIALDLFDSEVDGDAFKVKFGDWVSQDSFHLKAYYTDAFRGLNAVVYKWYDEIVKTHGVFNDYPWKRALIDFDSVNTIANGQDEIDDNSLQFFTGAKCFPLGFPVIVYQTKSDGTHSFYGIFSWQLKKHRDNYHMEKANEKNIHLDGIISDSVIFNANGDASRVNWIPGGDHGFEVRNPKDSCYVTESGNKYDAESSTQSQELAGVAHLGDTFPAYDNEHSYSAGEKCKVGKRIYMSRTNDNVGNDPSEASYGKKPDKVWDKATDNWIEITFCNSVKENILGLSTLFGKLADADAAYEASEKTPEDLAAVKEVIETYLDVSNQVDYFIFNNVINNWDGFNKNWQWMTWDGVKWFILPYDCDQLFGYWWDGIIVYAPDSTIFGSDTKAFRYINKYYREEFEERWAELRAMKLIDANHIASLINEWSQRVGIDNYNLEFEKWPESPSNRSSKVNATYWKRINSSTGTQPYDNTTNYAVGDKVSYSIQWRSMWFECVKECTGEVPCFPYTSNPTEGGTFDSITRIYKFLIERISLLDVYFNYNN